MGNRCRGGVFCPIPSKTPLGVNQQYPNGPYCTWTCVRNPIFDEMGALCPNLWLSLVQGLTKSIVLSENLHSCSYNMCICRLYRRSVCFSSVRATAGENYDRAHTTRRLELLGIDYRELLFHPDKADDMTGFDNGILVAFGMCLPCPLQEYYQMAPNVSQHTSCAARRRKFGGRTHTKLCTPQQRIGTLNTRWKSNDLFLIFVILA